MKSARQSSYPINNNILNRVSNRAMSGESLTNEELMPLFEAAKWAPSANNNQLTRFVYANRNTEYWESFLDLLAPGNQTWCAKASTLIIVLSRKISYHKDSPQRSHSFEAGAAFENLAIEGVSRGLVVHPMGGFDVDRAKHMLQLEDLWNIECMIAVGKPGQKEELPEDLQARETNPSNRKPLDEIVFEGKFNQK